MDEDSFAGGKKDGWCGKDASWDLEATGTPSKPKLTGVTGDGVRCIVAESLESLRTSWGVGGEEMMGVDAKLEVRECSASDGSRAGPEPASTELSFSSETSAPDELRMSMIGGTAERQVKSARRADCDTEPRRLLL